MLDDLMPENMISLKFGDMKKGYKFTEEFAEKYNFFTKEFRNFFLNKESYFKNPYQVLDYIDQKEIPVFFFFDFDGRLSNNTDTVRDYIEDYGRYIKTSSMVVEIKKDYGANIQVKVNLLENYKDFVKIQKLEGIENLETAKKIIDEYWEKKEEENKYVDYCNEMLRKRATRYSIKKY